MRVTDRKLTTQLAKCVGVEANDAKPKPKLTSWPLSINDIPIAHTIFRIIGGTFLRSSAAVTDEIRSGRRSGARSLRVTDTGLISGSST